MPATILIVDDSRFSRKVLRDVLEAAGHEVVEATDGRRALAVMARNRIALVITDVHMPDMDGPTLVRRLRSHARHRTVPVVLLTAATPARAGGGADEVDADAWLTKPLDAAKVRRTVRRLLRPGP